jgi:hypothetical protein
MLYFVSACKRLPTRMPVHGALPRDTPLLVPYTACFAVRLARFLRDGQNQHV